MAETAVNLVIDKLIPLLINEVRLQRSIQGQVHLIKQDLETIQSFLRDADAKAEREDTSEVVKSWVKQVREVAHRIEDVVDDYRLHVAKRRQKKTRRFFFFIGLLREASGMVKSMKPSHEIASEIGQITQAITALRQRKETFHGLLSEGSSSGSLLSPRNYANVNNNVSLMRESSKLVAQFVDEAQVVGFEAPKQELRNKLLDHKTTRTVIPVVGSAGLGKTTLVRILYNDNKVMKYFSCKAWVTVTRSFKVEELLRAMIKEFYKKNESALSGIENMEKEQLISKAREYLQKKRYLVVFDDVWTPDLWQQIDLALPPNEEGSRIIITTRNHKIAEFCKANAQVDPYSLKRLEPKEALNLFHKKAFQFGGGQCPPELRKLSSDIVHKCGGIPLAIVAIGGLLSSKDNDRSEWQRVHDHLGSRLSNDPHLSSFRQVLSESYYNLPYQLKLCLLYFGMFPEDYSISRKRLLRLWIAEGFVEENSDLSVEEVSEEYLTELINRSLVQVSWLDFDGKPRSCRVHDLMHDFILQKCRELNFCQVLKKAGSSSKSSTLTPRRLSIHDNDKGNLEGVPSRAVRSCIVFSMEKLPKPSINTLFSTFKLLKTLDFEDAPLNALPEEVGQLLHIRYLSVRNTKTKIIPRSIGNLQNLRTLDLKNSQVDELREEINNLIALRHLLGYIFNEEVDLSLDSLQGMKIKEGFGRLKALRKLYSVDTTHFGASAIKEFKKLKQLRKLGVTKLTRQNGKALCSAIEGMEHLCSLSIGAVDEHEFLDLGSLTHPRELLHRLYLKGKLEKFPIWIPKLKNLARLRLSWSGLMDDPIAALKDLQQLLELELYNAFDGDVLCFQVGWLRKLKILRLKELQGLKTLRIDEGALVNLERLHIGPCPQLFEVPVDIKNLENLHALRFYDVPDDFRQSMDPNQGAQFSIVEHVPSVLFYNKRGTANRYYCNSLHYHDALKSKFGSEDYDVGAFLESIEMDESGVPMKLPAPFESKPDTTDKLFWATASLFSVFVVILVLLSKFLDHGYLRG